MGGMQDDEWCATKVLVKNGRAGQIYEGSLRVFIFHFLRWCFMQAFKVKRCDKSAGCYLPSTTQAH